MPPGTSSLATGQACLSHVLSLELNLNDVLNNKLNLKVVKCSFGVIGRIFSGNFLAIYSTVLYSGCYGTGKNSSLVRMDNFWISTQQASSIKHSCIHDAPPWWQQEEYFSAYHTIYFITAGVVRESGAIRKCFDEYWEDFVISDELRKVKPCTSAFVLYMYDMLASIVRSNKQCTSVHCTCMDWTWNSRVFL